MTKNMTTFASRKFVMSSVCLVMVFVAFMMDKISQDVFMPFVLGILGTYSIANTVSKFTNTTSVN